MFSSLVSHTGRNSVLPKYTYTHITTPPAHPWPLPTPTVFTTAEIKPLDCPDNWHAEQKQRLLLDKTYHNPPSWGGGGFQGHQDSYSQHPETWRDLRERHCEVLVWDLVWHSWEEWWLVTKRIDYTQGHLLPSVIHVETDAWRWLMLS